MNTSGDGCNAQNSVELRVRLRSMYRRQLRLKNGTRCRRLYLIFGDASALFTVFLSTICYTAGDLVGAQRAQNFMELHENAFKVSAEYCLELRSEQISFLTEGTLSEAEQIEIGTMAKGCLTLNEEDWSDWFPCFKIFEKAPGIESLHPVFVNRALTNSHVWADSELARDLRLSRMLLNPLCPIPDLCTVHCGPSERLPIAYALKVNVTRVDTPFYEDRSSSIWRYKLKVLDHGLFNEPMPLGPGVVHVMNDAPNSLLKLFKGDHAVRRGSVLLLMGVSGQRLANGTMDVHMLTRTATAVLFRW